MPQRAVAFHHSAMLSSAAVIRLSSGFFAQYSAILIPSHLVEIDDGGGVFGAVIALQPHHYEGDVLGAAGDEVLALDGRHIEPLRLGRNGCRQQRCGCDHEKGFRGMIRVFDGAESRLPGRL